MIEDLIAHGEIGGRTAQVVESGEVVCATYDPAPLPEGWVRVRTVRSAISPGTEMTFVGRSASNVYLAKTWDADLRLFEPGRPTLEYPVTFGYRAAGVVVETRAADVAAGARIYGNWRHTEYVAMPEVRAVAQRLPDELSWDDGIDVGQMGPICVNAVAWAENQHVGAPGVVIGAGPIGLITAQVARATGAKPVYVVERLASRRAIAAELGFDVLAADADVARTLKERHGSEGIPVVWECTGSTAALNEAVRIVRRRGTVLAVGFYQGESNGLYLGDEFHHNGVRIQAAQIGNIHPSTDLAGLRAQTLELLADDRIQLGALPRTVVAIEQVAEGFELLKRPDEVLQVALRYESPGPLDKLT